MELYLNIEQSFDVKELIRIKRTIQEEVTKPMHWKEKNRLYKQIQTINERVRDLLDA
ncbi:hypothetical protein [Aneurinibacillus uraniidurans]|uniref:hypothetical protein n=1 Tax=Aneurinibacillus uraniidurans TaxID=2966586 RepID=UPI002349AAF3|nr:hypothetical protein [Aneurinibacillus sp. B1]WCN36257.1 hypothetical protein PO771_10160 [Aneurinibacillus sp. B1]